MRVWRSRGERSARVCTLPKTAFNGKTALVVVDRNLNARRYIDEILQPDHGAKRIAPRRQRPTPPRQDRGRIPTATTYHKD